MIRFLLAVLRIANRMAKGYVPVARPKQLKFSGNKMVRLYNFSHEEQQRIIEIMKPSGRLFDYKAAEERSLPNSAIGMRLNPVNNKYELVVLEVDFDTKQSKVKEVISASQLKADAVDQFKMLAVKLGLV